MHTVTIGELRRNWPKIERRLRVTRRPLLVIRDWQPVAQISPLPEPAGNAVAFDAEVHHRWLRRIWGTKVRGIDSGAWPAKDRAYRIP